MNRFAIRAITVALCCVLTTPAMALDAPKHSRADHRVRYANYNPADVINLNAVIGVASVIVLEDDEVYKFHVFGDSEAYEFTHFENNLFFKPIANDADSNLIVITNKRNYTFKVTYSNDRNSQALYKLVMRYPDTKAKERYQENKKQAVKQSFAKVGQPVNWASYTKSGDIELAPVHIWDDGRQTWMQFNDTAEIPAIYRVTSTGQEVITNHHMADPTTLVLHRTADRWHLRLGEQVAAIHNGNKGYVPYKPNTGTASPNVERVVIGAEKQELPPPAPKLNPITPVYEVSQPASDKTPTPALAPAKVWVKDGQTWMQFKQKQLPSVQPLNEAGRPYNAKISIRPKNTLVVQSTSAKWLISKGNDSITFDIQEIQK